MGVGCGDVDDLGPTQVGARRQQAQHQQGRDHGGRGTQPARAGAGPVEEGPRHPQEPTQHHCAQAGREQAMAGVGKAEYGFVVSKRRVPEVEPGVQGGARDLGPATGHQQGQAHGAQRPAPGPALAVAVPRAPLPTRLLGLRRDIVGCHVGGPVVGIEHGHCCRLYGRSHLLRVQ